MTRTEHRGPAKVSMAQLNNDVRSSNYFKVRKFEFWHGIRRLRHLTEISGTDSRVSAREYINDAVADITLSKENKEILERLHGKDKNKGKNRAKDNNKNKKSNNKKNKWYAYKDKGNKGRKH